MVLRLSDSQSGVVAVPAPPRMIGVLVNELPASEKGAVKSNDQLVVFAVVQHVRDIYALGDKHVVGFQDRFSIENDSGKSVEAFKGQDCLRTAAHLGTRKGGSIRPDGFTDPLDIVFILADKGILDDVVVHQVEMNIGRELGDWEILGVLGVGLFELPVRVDGNDGAGDHAGLMNH